MRLLGHNRLFQAAAVAAGIVALSSTDALARSRGSHGSYGSYGSSGSSASYGSYGSSGSSASYGGYATSYSSSGSSASYGSSSSGGRPGLFARWHARKAAKHSSGSSASYGAYYAHSSSGSSASYGAYYGSSSGGSGSSSGGSYGGYSAPAEYYEAPAVAPPATPQPEAPPIETAASIQVTVPGDALVFVNDRPTTSTGSERTFVSRGLSAGRTYAYSLRVEVTRAGQKVVENKLVRLAAGETIDLSFGAGEQIAADEAASTELTLHVPAGATVTLAGAVTAQTGETRTYATNSLASGQEWDGYTVRVELERDGRTLVQERTMSIVGGERYEL
ncbi:MAG TPA: TIGR03000 domain-containing protein, partial [Lacipirellulaceae bacterium]|nr:TIGR03000 domain-containing protein [Lacipirellulaceae bacterium]